MRHLPQLYAYEVAGAASNPPPGVAIQMSQKEKREAGAPTLQLGFRSYADERRERHAGSSAASGREPRDPARDAGTNMQTSQVTFSWPSGRVAASNGGGQRGKSAEASALILRYPDREILSDHTDTRSKISHDAAVAQHGGVGNDVGDESAPSSPSGLEPKATAGLGERQL